MDVNKINYRGSHSLQRAPFNFKGPLYAISVRYVRYY